MTWQGTAVTAAVSARYRAVPHVSEYGLRVVLSHASRPRDRLCLTACLLPPGARAALQHLGLWWGYMRMEVRRGGGVRGG